MITVPTIAVMAGVVITLFMLVLVKRLTAGSSNPILVGVNDGLSFITS